LYPLHPTVNISQLIAALIILVIYTRLVSNTTAPGPETKYKQVQIQIQVLETKYNEEIQKNDGQKAKQKE
jgi:hypothetical protein